MKKLITGLCALALATPAMAASPSDESLSVDVATMVPARLRYGFVYNLALRTCTAAWQGDGKPSDLLTSVEEKAGLNEDEALLLAQFCVLYMKGRNRD